MLVALRLLTPRHLAREDQIPRTHPVRHPSYQRGCNHRMSAGHREATSSRSSSFGLSTQESVSPSLWDDKSLQQIRLCCDVGVSTNSTTGLAALSEPTKTILIPSANSQDGNQPIPAPKRSRHQEIALSSRSIVWLADILHQAARGFRSRLDLRGFRTSRILSKESASGGKKDCVGTLDRT